ncbi:hypothetical protein QE152_g29084 [Popillia japonica]|uniref:Uncharacterized protein n=1 Tax=Popillia japonica TaxID=7064 RepID=A0AAW1JJC0_POPJA
MSTYPYPKVQAIQQDPTISYDKELDHVYLPLSESPSDTTRSEDTSAKKNFKASAEYRDREWRRLSALLNVVTLLVLDHPQLGHFSPNQGGQHQRSLSGSFFIPYNDRNPPSQQREAGSFFLRHPGASLSAIKPPG